MNDVPWADLALNLLAVTAAIVVFVGAIMATAIRIKNQSIIDIFWGPGFVVAAIVSYLMSNGSGGDDTRRIVVLALTTIWGLRLGLHIGHRNRGHGEDRRYTALMRHQTGSLVGYLVRRIYGLQGVLIIVVSLPVQFAMYQRTSLGVIGGLGIALWVIGFAFETIGDWQLARFKAEPGHAGQIMDRGLWGWTRHPNYFGDACVWAGLFLLALGAPWGLVAIISPIVMTRLLVSFTGKALLEKGMRRSRGEAYERYVANTSGFIPRPPRRRPADERHRP
ncbi:MAG: DUF1295 domain-containing protein [Humibacillus sp.]|nr:DUF1295 domain-containing protein [Humibacillus sp.]MDN5779898.1 DUF1295 domain-containing protein [Humibacillus sp.]